jgi:CRP/FNR family transcriptional regulator, cyclic AMP receptor protein
MSGVKALKKGEILFREGDESDSMFVIKSGKILITKAKGTSEVILAELGPGEMLGEMAFFDNRPRSAGAMAAVDTVVIILPFKALNAQFKTFPEWLKAVVRTVNNHLRNANQKIKNLEKSTEEASEYLPAHLVTQLTGTLGLVASHYGEKKAEGVEVPYNTLRKYTIQVYQLPTAKMDKTLKILETFGYAKQEDLGEGKFRVVIMKLDELVAFVSFYTDWLFKAEDKKITIFEKELKTMKVLVHFAAKVKLNDKGEARVNLTQIQADAQTEMGIGFDISEVDTLVEKGLLSQKLTIDGAILIDVHLQEMSYLLPHWQLIHAFKAAHRDA